MNNNLKFRDLAKQYNVLKPEIDKAMTNIAASGGYIMGKAVKELEKELAEYVGVKHCITCANGTDALTLALKAWGVGKGDAIFVPDFTFFASAEVISLEGATPVFVDVDKDTFNMDVISLSRAIEKTIQESILIPKVIITVDLFGLPANYPEIQKIANKFNLLILEDGAQGFGGNIDGKKSCSFGDISTTSFFPAKPLGCYGDGGAIFTDNDEWAEIINSLKVHGRGKYKYDNVRFGINSRLDTIQAAILMVKFNAFKEYELSCVNKAAALYSEILMKNVKTPVVPISFYSSWAQYTITLKNRNQRDCLQSYLEEQGIPSMIYYPIPMHKQLAYRELDFGSNSNPVSKRLCETVLSLPMHPYLNEEDILLVSSKIISYLLKDN